MNNPPIHQSLVFWRNVALMNAIGFCSATSPTGYDAETVVEVAKLFDAFLDGETK